MNCIATLTVQFAETKPSSGSNQKQQDVLYPQPGHPLSTSVAATSAGLDFIQNQRALSTSPKDISEDSGSGVSKRVQQLFSVDHTGPSTALSQPPLLKPKPDNASLNSSSVMQGVSTQNFSPTPNYGVNSTHSHPIHLAPQSFSPHPSSENFLKTATLAANTDVLSQHDKKLFKGNPNETASSFALSDDNKSSTDFSNLSSGSNMPQNDRKKVDQMKSDNHDLILSEVSI